MVDSLKEQAFNSMQWTAGSSIYVSVIQLVQLPILAFFLSPEEIGTMTILLMTIWLTQAFSDGGMSPAIIHYKIVAQDLLNTLFLLNICYAVGLYILLNILAFPIAALFGHPELSVYFPAAMFAVIMAAAGTQFRIIMTKELRFDLIALQDVATATTYLIIAISLAALGFGVWSMVIGYLSGTALGTLVTVYYGSRYWWPSFNFTTKGLGKFVRFGRFQIGERVLIFLNSRLDQLMIGGLIGPHALGIYTIAHSFVITPTVRINQIISSVMFPVFARMQEQAQMLRNNYLKLVKVVTMLNTPILLGMILVAPLFIPLLFDDQWHDSIYILQILGVYALIRSTGAPSGSLQLAKGRADLGFKWNLFLMVVSAPCIYAGAQLGGLTGVAWSLLMLHMLLFISFWFLMIRPLIKPPGKDYFLVLFHAILPGLFMAGFVWVIGHISVFPGLIINLAVMILTGILLFFVFAFYLERTLFLEIRDLIKKRYFSH
ncbi:MAG: MOP flippase family protein [Balneolales bacterium]